jgi:hypothetical protein
MVSALVVNLNTYGTRTEADTYLEDSPRTTAWAFVDEDTKDRSLIAATREIEKQVYDGERTGVEVYYTVAINAGGSGYAVGNTLELVGGAGTAATFRVTSVSTGAVTGIQALNAGLYSTNPGTTAVATTGGAGTGCTLDLTWQDQVLSFPRTGLTDKDGSSVDSDTAPLAVKHAQFELAYLISQDPDLEGSSGTSDNNKRLKAGSAEIERFKPVEGPRFPNIVFELLGQFMGGLSSPSAPFVSGNEDESSFDDEWGLNLGFA